MLRKSRQLKVWGLGNTEQEIPPQAALDDMQQGESLSLGAGHTSLLNLTIKGQNLACAAISPNGKFIACSDRLASKLYYVKFVSGEKTVVEKLTLPKHTAAVRLTFSPDSIGFGHF